MLSLFILFLIGIQIVNAVRIRHYLSKTLFAPSPKAPSLDSFTITNPYDVPGEYHKAQLHLHTSNSRDVARKIPVRDTILKYQEAGYSFVVITDHDLITTYLELNSSGFICLPGIEITLPFIFWPLGKHLTVINPARARAEHQLSAKITIGKLFKHTLFSNSLIAPAHPNWRGNLGTGFWFPADILKLSGCQLIEIHNHHSDSSLDVRLWHNILTIQGHQQPVWGIAVDDTDNGEPLDRGWIMVKTEDISETSFITALKNGNFYATTGPVADFRVNNGMIEVKTAAPAQINFIDSQNKIVNSFLANSGSYHPQGHEGFVRIEIRDEHGGSIWSQPFFLVPAPPG